MITLFQKVNVLVLSEKNGAGKSTFIRMVQQLESADSGKINVGDTVVFGHYSQQGLEVKEDMRVIEYVKNIAENFPLANGGSLSAAQFLQLFLFDPDKQYTYISKLSGGEKEGCICYRFFSAIRIFWCWMNLPMILTCQL
ncbi:MAG: ATP-binding cassette domain-containing protein [Chitinophagaceae bacterium]|nr:ATP-binding cassette domain-containing protein [Chitinophagaceae bacterium]